MGSQRSPSRPYFPGPESDVVGGHPADLYIRRKKVQFGKLRSPLGEGGSQRCSHFTAGQEVPLGKGRDHILCGEASAWENQFAECAPTPVKPSRGLLVRMIGLCLLEPGSDGIEPSNSPKYKLRGAHASAVIESP